MTVTLTARPARSAAAAPAGRALPVAVAAVIVLLPFGAVGVPGVGLRLAYVAMAAAAGLGLLRIARDQARLPASVLLLGLGLGVVAGLVSAALGVAPEDSVPLVVISLITLGYATAVALAYRPGHEVHALDLLVVVGGAVAAAALFSGGELRAFEGGSVVEGRLTGPFAQPNELGMFCAALLPVAVACLVTSASRRRMAVLGVAAACLAAAWVMSMSRGAWIGGAAALVCLAVCEPATRRALGAVTLAVVATCIAAVAAPANAAVLGVVGARIRSLGDPSQNQYDDRPLTWAEAWRQAAEHPWFGVGPGGFRSAAGESVSAVSADPAEHPHNLLLTVLADRGVVGLALGLVVVAGCVIAARRHLMVVARFDTLAPVARTRAVAVLAALTAVVVHGAFDMPLRNPILAGLVWTLLGMAVVAETARTASPSDPEASLKVSRSWS